MRFYLFIIRDERYFVHTNIFLRLPFRGILRKGPRRIQRNIENIVLLLVMAGEKGPSYK